MAVTNMYQDQQKVEIFRKQNPVCEGLKSVFFFFFLSLI